MMRERKIQNYLIGRKRERPKIISMKDILVDFFILFKVYN